MGSRAIQLDSAKRAFWREYGRRRTVNRDSIQHFPGAFGFGEEHTLAVAGPSEQVWLFVGAGGKFTQFAAGAGEQDDAIGSEAAGALRTDEGQITAIGRIAWRGLGGFGSCKGLDLAAFDLHLAQVGLTAKIGSGTRTGFKRNGSGIGRPVEAAYAEGACGQPPRRPLPVDVRIGGNQVEGGIGGILIDDPKVPLLLARELHIGADGSAREGEPFAVGREMIGSGHHARGRADRFRLATIHGHAIKAPLAFAFGCEINEVSVGRELRGGCALLAAGQLQALRAIRMGDIDLRVHLALLTIHERSGFHPGDHLPVSRGRDVRHGLHAHLQFGGPLLRLRAANCEYGQPALSEHIDPSNPDFSARYP